MSRSGYTKEPNAMRQYWCLLTLVFRLLTAIMEPWIALKAHAYSWGFMECRCTPPRASIPNTFAQSAAFKSRCCTHYAPKCTRIFDFRTIKTHRRGHISVVGAVDFNVSLRWNRTLLVVVRLALFLLRDSAPESCLCEWLHTTQACVRRFHQIKRTQLLLTH